MMLGLDVKLTVGNLPEDYVREITRAFPKAFVPISTSWYGYAPQIILETLRGTEKQHSGWVSISMTKETWDNQQRKFYAVLQTEKPNGLDYESLGLPGVGMWTSFDTLSHFGDIMFATKKLFEDGHKVEIEYKEC